TALAGGPLPRPTAPRTRAAPLRAPQAPRARDAILLSPAAHRARVALAHAQAVRRAAAPFLVRAERPAVSGPRDALETEPASGRGLLPEREPVREPALAERPTVAAAKPKEPVGRSTPGRPRASALEPAPVRTVRERRGCLSCWPAARRGCSVRWPGHARRRDARTPRRARPFRRARWPGYCDTAGAVAPCGPRS